MCVYVYVCVCRVEWIRWYSRLGNKQRQLARVRSNGSSFRIGSRGDRNEFASARPSTGARSHRKKGYGRMGEEERNDSLPIADNAIIAARWRFTSRYLFSAGVNRLVIDRSRVLLANDPVESIVARWGWIGILERRCFFPRTLPDDGFLCSFYLYLRISFSMYLE